MLVYSFIYIYIYVLPNSFELVVVPRSVPLSLSLRESVCLYVASSSVNPASAGGECRLAPSLHAGRGCQ